jgi:hypothetical protein
MNERQWSDRPVVAWGLVAICIGAVVLAIVWQVIR